MWQFKKAEELPWEQQLISHQGENERYSPIALWASSTCFMHAAISPFFISALDMSRCIVASFS